MPFLRIPKLFLRSCGIVFLSVACQSPPPTTTTPQMPKPPSSIPSLPQPPQPQSNTPRSTPPIPNLPNDSSPQDSGRNQQLPTPELIPGIPDSEQGSEKEEAQDSKSDEGWETSNELPSNKNEQGVEQSSGPDGNEKILGIPSSYPIDRELDEALEVFDGEILSGRADIMTRANETAMDNEYEEQSEYHENEQTGQAQGQNDQGTDPSNASRPRQSPTMTPASLPPASPVPPDIPDAKDDDVVARQLREAALGETDSELREKLWDEYRRYTDGR